MWLGNLLLVADIASLEENVTSIREELKAKKAELKTVEKEFSKLEEQKAEVEAREVEVKLVAEKLILRPCGKYFNKNIVHTAFCGSAYIVCNENKE